MKHFSIDDNYLIKINNWGKIIQDFIFKRIIICMPYYYSSKNKEFGHIEITPHEWYRKFFRLKNFSFIPYMVGDVITFHLKLEKLPTSPYNYKTYVLEKTGNNQPLQMNKEITTSDEKIEGEARWTGDTRFFLIHHSSPIFLSKIDPKECIELFYEDVHSLTSYLYGPAGIVSAIIAGIIVGFILAHL